MLLTYLSKAMNSERIDVNALHFLRNLPLTIGKTDDHCSESRPILEKSASAQCFFPFVMESKFTCTAAVAYWISDMNIHDL